jgi:hypothetical protein
MHSTSDLADQHETGNAAHAVSVQLTLAAAAAFLGVVGWLLTL